MSDVIKEVGRLVSQGYYNYQEIRISSMNRIRDIIRKKNEDIKIDEVEEKKEKKRYDEKYKDENLLKTLEKLSKDNKINDKEYKYLDKAIKTTINSKKIENEYKKSMLEYVKNEKIYVEFLSRIKGFGAVLSANLIKNLGYCEKFPCVSALWSYSGLKVVDGEAVKKKKGEQLNYNPYIKMLMWRVCDSFIKQNTPFYRELYDKEKEKQMKRLELVEKGKEKEIKEGTAPKSLMHAHLRAMRKTAKIFLQHYWCCSRELVNLEVNQPYIIAHSEGKHIKYLTYQDAIKKNIKVLKNNVSRDMVKSRIKKKIKIKEK